MQEILSLFGVCLGIVLPRFLEMEAQDMLTKIHATPNNRFSGYIRHKQDSSFLGTNTVYLKGEVTETNAVREREFHALFINLMGKILKNPKKYKPNLDQNGQGFSFEKGQIRYQLLKEPSGKALQIETPEAIEAIGTYCKPFNGLFDTVANWQTKVKNRNALNRTINQFEQALEAVKGLKTKK